MLIKKSAFYQSIQLKIIHYIYVPKRKMYFQQPFGYNFLKQNERNYSFLKDA